MAEDTRTTFEIARLCPRCNLPGEDVSQTPVKNSKGQPAVVHNIFCRNEKCEWYNTSYLVQVNPDGTVPQPYEQLGEKKYPRLSQESETRIMEAIETQVQMEIQPGGVELRNPNRR